MSKMILNEYVSPDINRQSVFMEDTEDAFGNKGKSLHMKGIFIQGNVRNANQRIYPLEEIKRAVNKLQEDIKNNVPILGECDHPSDLKINLDRVTHQIVDIHMDGPNGIGKLKILPTPMGKLVEAMITSGVRLGVSSRGSGEVNESTGHVSGFDIITVDIVAQPSAPHAYPKAIYESLMNMRHGHRIFDVAREATQDQRVQKYVQEGVIRLIKELKLK